MSDLPVFVDAACMDDTLNGSSKGNPTGLFSEPTSLSPGHTGSEKVTRASSPTPCLLWLAQGHLLCLLISRAETNVGAIGEPKQHSLAR